MASPDADDEAGAADNGDNLGAHASGMPAAEGSEPLTTTGSLDEERSRQDACAPRVKTAEPDRDAMMAAIREVFAAGDALETETAIRAVARQLGFQRTGSRIQYALRLALRAAVTRGMVRREDDLLVIDGRNIGDYSREQLIDALRGAMGSGWCEREDAVRAAARYFGFRRTGSAIRDAFKSAINGAIRRGLLEYNGAMIRRVK